MTLDPFPDLEPEDLSPGRLSAQDYLFRAAGEMLQPRPEREDSATSDAERSLYEFTRQAWHVLEPNNWMRDGWHVGCLCEHFQAVTDLEITNLIVNVPPGHMKLCAHSTPIATPDGYKTHGDIRPGDRVFGPDGKPVRVLRVSPESPADLEVVFSTGEVVKCNGDHLWTVYDRWANKWKTLRTADIQAARPDRGRSRFFIPDEPRLQHPPRRLPLHPYFLGCWLGDGTATKPALTHHAEDVAHLKKLEHLGYKVTARYEAAAVTSEFRHQGVVETLRSLGLVGNKHIPEDYLTASDRQRLELLAGLIDTDGHVDPDCGRVRISTCSQALAGQIQLLAVSLGFRAYINEAEAPGYEGYPPSEPVVYQVGFYPDRTIPTALPRKRVHLVEHVKRRRAIVEVRPAAVPEVGRCLTIDRPDGLYLVGTGNLVTHNSLTSGVMWFAWEWARHPETRWLYGSYGSDLVRRDAGKAKDLIRSRWYQARWGNVFQIRRTRDTIGRFENDRTGYRISTTVLGKGMGERADYAVWDDPHKASEIHSKAKRDGVVQAYVNTILTRAGDPTKFRKVLIMQRLHEKDLAGYLLSEQTGWEHLCLPAQYEPARYFLPQDTPAPAGGDGASADPGLDWMRKAQPPRYPITPTKLQIRRPELRDPRTRPFEPLWPEMYPEPALEDLKWRLTAVGSAGQLQQRPAPEKGSIYAADLFRHFTLETGRDGGRYVQLGAKEEGNPDPRTIALWELRFFQTADTAIVNEATAAYTSVVTFAWHLRTHTLLVWHVWRGRLEVYEQMEALKQLHAGKAHFDPARRLWDFPGRLRPWPNPVLFQGVEDKGSGIGLLREARIAGVPLRPLKAVHDKVIRSAAVVTMLAQGRLWFRAGAPWLADFEDELLSFPNGAFADQADCLAYGGMVAGEDSLLNADIEGDLTSWPPPPVNQRGEEVHPSQAPGEHEEVYQVRGVDVTFDDRSELGGLADWD